MVSIYTTIFQKYIDAVMINKVRLHLKHLLTYALTSVTQLVPFPVRANAWVAGSVPGQGVY